MPKIKSHQPPKEFPGELFQENQPRSIHTINLQPDRPELPTPESEAAKYSLLASLDSTLDLVGAYLLSINYNSSQSNSSVSISIVASHHSATFIKSLLPHYSHHHHHHHPAQPQDAPF